MSNNLPNTGQCSMRSQCGTNGGKPLPCAYDGPPQQLEGSEAHSLLTEVCGSEFADGPVCCSIDQVAALKANFVQAEALIASCPACRNNFRSFFCSFTCSPQQAEFVNVTATQDSNAVKSADFFVTETFGKGFYDSCKDVQFGATNGYAMDFIGGGAKDYRAFFKFLGDVKPFGSPFQINFPNTPPSETTPYNPPPKNCYDNDLSSRCTCIDCPDICPTLPPVPLPDAGPSCVVGSISCLSFFLTIAYGLAVLGFLTGYTISSFRRLRRERSYERVALAEDTASPRIHARSLVGAASLSQYLEDDSIGAQSESRNLGRGAALLDPIETVQPRQYRLNNILRRASYKLGLVAAMNPWLMFSAVFLVVGLLNIGWKKFTVETDPVRLWVAPDSESLLQKEYFDEHFGPFYKTEQMFITALTQSSEFGNETQATSIHIGDKGPVLNWDRLKYWFDVEDEIRSLRSPNGYTLDDVCFKPAGPRGACVVQSVTAWFADGLDAYDRDTWAEHFEDCALNPIDCLPDFEQPLEPQFVLGGVPLDENGHKDFVKAEALVVTYVVSDSLDADKQAIILEWETTVREHLMKVSKESEEAGLSVIFSTGVSLEEELNKSTNTDVRIVVLSYLAMFLYVSLSLGSGTGARDDDSVISSLTRWVRNFPGLFKRSAASSSLSIDSRNVPTILPHPPRSLFVNSKVVLGFFSIALVLLSISSTVGFFSLLGVKVTLIIAEVIPFLVLAVGVDNVFILIHELDRQNALHGPNATLSTHGGYSAPMSPTQSHRSPFDSTHADVDDTSLPLYLSAEERVARTLAKMGPSILLSTVTETTAFALGALVPMPAVRNFALYAAGSVLINATLQVTVFISALLLDLKRTEASRVDCFPCIQLPSRIALSETSGHGIGIGFMARLIRRYYAPFLLKPVVKVAVVIIFLGTFVASIISMQHVELGLDQRLALPSDSYLVPYFDHVDAYLDIGPPVYFVAKNVDVTQRRGQQTLCGRFSTCMDVSITNRLEAERKRSETSFINQPAASWIDNFLAWLNPVNDECCLIKEGGPPGFCPRPSPRCKPCYEDHEPGWNITMDGLPENEDFMIYLKHWLNSPTNAECSLAGKSAFGQSLSVNDDFSQVEASHFRTFHTPLKSQNDFINALAAANRIADEISKETGTEVFPYSLFYVFFDQYAHIIGITQEVLGLGLASVLIVNAILLGSLHTATIVTTVVALTVVTVMGVMPLWGISLNAISLVNLVISLGIAVEFCAHVARAFMNQGSLAQDGGPIGIGQVEGQKGRDERVLAALVDVGPSVLSGITLTKLIGMSVLALTRSKLLEIYYFRMWLTLIISGALHGLVLLPVVLSLAGGQGLPPGTDEEWMAHAIRNEYESYPPFLADDDDSLNSD